MANQETSNVRLTALAASSALVTSKSKPHNTVSADTVLWGFDFEVTSAEEAAKAVNRTFDVSWLAIGTSYDVYAEAEVDKYAAWWYQDDSAETGEISVLVEPPSAVPIPAAAWLFGSAILGLLGVARRKKA